MDMANFWETVYAMMNPKIQRGTFTAEEARYQFECWKVWFDYGNKIRGAQGRVLLARQRRRRGK